MFRKITTRGCDATQRAASPPGWVVNLSASCSSDASGFPCSCPLAPADVAANLIHLATIAQRPPRQGCPVGGAPSATD